MNTKKLVVRQPHILIYIKDILIYEYENQVNCLVELSCLSSLACVMAICNDISILIYSESECLDSEIHYSYLLHPYHFAYILISGYILWHFITDFDLT